MQRLPVKIFLCAVQTMQFNNIPSAVQQHYAEAAGETSLFRNMLQRQLMKRYSKASPSPSQGPSQSQSLETEPELEPRSDIIEPSEEYLGTQ